MMWGYPGYDYGVGGWVAMALMMLFGLLVLLGFIMLIVWIVRSATSPGHTQHGQHRGGTAEACDIARLRYARGEITREQFEEICRTVGG